LAVQNLANRYQSTAHAERRTPNAAAHSGN
jgi:hypothetical protein